MTERKVLKKERLDTYELVTEQMDWNDDKGNPGVMTSAYNLKGYYIGNPKDAKVFADKGIVPEVAKTDDKVCSIGFCEKENKWYGWSHRAMYGFGIGDVVKEGDCAATSGYIEGYLEKHPEDDVRIPVGFEVKTLEDAKRVAIAFADSVS